jgi:hypothetical protein
VWGPVHSRERKDRQSSADHSDEWFYVRVFDHRASSKHEQPDHGDAKRGQPRRFNADDKGERQHADEPFPSRRFLVERDQSLSVLQELVSTVLEELG